MKKFLVLVIASLMVMSASAEVKKHTIDRGETIESVAKLYNVTPNAIREANPEIGDMFYVGMIILIPEPMVNSVDVVDIPIMESVNDTKIVKEEQEKIDLKSDEENHLPIKQGEKYLFSRVRYDGRTFKNNNTEYSYGSIMGYEFSIGGGYYLVNNLYLEGALGYSSASFTQKFKRSYGGDSYDISSWGFSLPVHLGVSLPFGKMVKMNIYTGPEFTFPVSTSVKVNNKKLKDSGDNAKIGTSVALGVELNIYGTIIGANLGYPLQKGVKDVKYNYAFYLAFSFGL